MLRTEYPKVLIFSHNCFSKTISNGRTLNNFFIDWPIDRLAQFYIYNELPGSTVCNNYFRVLDMEALKAFCTWKTVGHKIDLLKEKIIESPYILSNYKKNSYKYLIRNLIWDSKRWRSNSFYNWIEEFKPDIIFVQIGDYTFMHRLALEVAQKRNIPLVIYNSEDYYFQKKISFSPLYFLYKKDYKNQFRKLIAYASNNIYISDMLQQTYQREFNHRSTVIMTSTDMMCEENKEKELPFTISYLGTLGVGRHTSLIEIAEAIRNVMPNYFLDIYGNAPNKQIKRELENCSGIRLKGFVSYKNVVNIMKKSSLLVYAESFKWGLKNAFSTKIADSLACGTCLFAYGPEDTASIKYLRENEAACVVSDSSQLETYLKEIITNKDLRRKYIINALNLAKTNHDMDINKRYFRKILMEVSQG
jgi:UDP-N-acetylglucosamine 2-epimerase